MLLQSYCRPFKTFDARTLLEIEQLMEPAVKQLREDLGI